MLEIKTDEKIVLALHRHWIIIVGKIIGVIMLLFTPLLFSAMGWNIINKMLPGGLSVLFLFCLSVYFLFIYLLLFISWMDYYLDMWVITNQRILDVEHYGIFRREVSEFSLKNVQDVTIEIPGMLASLLKYGNVVVQTAGERNFKVREIPNPEKIKDVIIEYSKLAQNNGANSKTIFN